MLKYLFHKQGSFSLQNKAKMIEIFRQKIPQFELKKNQIQQINEYAQQLSKSIVEYKRVQLLAWNGIPQLIRPKIWKYLLKYCFINDAENILYRKRQQYRKYIKNYWAINNMTEQQKNIIRTIDGDVKRIGSQYIDICKYDIIQLTLKRILLILHMRHPQTGYVQGMCDIAIPFLIVFLKQYVPISEQMKITQQRINTLNQQNIKQIQADTYWCMSKMIQTVLSNYTHGFGGLQYAYKQVEQKLQLIDPELALHFKTQNIDLFGFSFKNISTMMLRMFSPKVSFRLLDTYISFEEEYPQFMIYLLIAILQKFAKKMLKMKFDQIMTLLQKLPTKLWTQKDIQFVIAQAYVYMIQFKKKK